MSRLKILNFRFKILYLALILFAGCNPEAHWETSDVKIEMSVQTVSAGFIECSFSTTKDAYYLIAVQEVEEGYNPMEHQKQFMTLALDSANTEYIQWRYGLLKQGESNIAPFSSHTLQYGNITHFFTGLLPGVDYWVFAFIVNPETKTPVGKLYIQQVTTTDESIMDIHFAYRVKGLWDYVYPTDSVGNIYSRFPYVATTRDSAQLRHQMEEEGAVMSPQLYFQLWLLRLFLIPAEAEPLYGVKAVYNDGINSYLGFEPGHTYYTAIGGFDGSFKQYTLYKFHWDGPQTEFYMTDSLSIADGDEW